MFNVGTGLGVFAALPLILPALHAAASGGTDPTTCLSAFHTAFNVVGVLAFARRRLALRETFPEIARLPFVGRLLG